MDELKLRQQIIDACNYLVKTGLIARTWGNVSARLNDHEFLITPSGLAYEKTKPEDIVKVNIDTLEYDESQRKPSSEKRIHAYAYQLRKDVNFIVHTHQFYASAICAEEKDVMIDNTLIPCAKYGLPGTKKLSENVIEVYKNNPNSNMFLMSKHGTICFGNNNKDALNNAQELESICKKLFEQRVPSFYVPNKMKKYLDDYAQIVPANKNEDQEALRLVTEKNAAANLYAKDSKPIGLIDATIQHLVYSLKYSKLKDN